MLAFADGGLVKLRDPLPGTESQLEIYGAGLGMRMMGPLGLEGALDVAWPLKDTDSVESGDKRLHFLLRSGF